MRELLELNAIVRGNVQGVGFRATAKFYADKMQIKGFARNLPDGTVELCGQGEKAALEKWISELKREFSSRHIEDFACKYHPAEKTYADFKVLL